MDGQQAAVNTIEQSIAAVHLKQKEEAARLGLTHRDYSFAVCTLQAFGRSELRKMIIIEAPGTHIKSYESISGLITKLLEIKQGKKGLYAPPAPTVSRKRKVSEFERSFEELFCPITMVLPVDPVFAEDGHVYEREAIRDWNRKGNGKSPKTNKPMAPGLRPAVQIKSMISIAVETGALVGDKATTWKKLTAKAHEEKVKAVAKAARAKAQAEEKAAAEATATAEAAETAATAKA